jgi:hypothetical protein
VVALSAVEASAGNWLVVLVETMGTVRLEFDFVDC